MGSRQFLNIVFERLVFERENFHIDVIGHEQYHGHDNDLVCTKELFHVSFIYSPHRVGGAF